MKVLDKGRLHIAAVATGAAKRMLADTLRYAMKRKQFGKPIVREDVRDGNVRTRGGSCRADFRWRRVYE